MAMIGLVAFAAIELSLGQLPQRDADIPIPPSQRLVIDGELVTDAMFDLDHDDPMQVAQCRACAQTWCEDGNAVVARRVGEAVVWMTPPNRAYLAHGCEDRFAPLPIV